MRKRYGYTASETRTKAERDETAARIMAKQPPVRSIEDEEGYVAYQLAVTRQQMEAGRLGDHDGKRLERCEAYARWRWAGFHAGEIASL